MTKEDLIAFKISQEGQTRRSPAELARFITSLIENPTVILQGILDEMKADTLKQQTSAADTTSKLQAVAAALELVNVARL